ncbi:MAG: fumarylacetoacetate hydrolase family protein [Candidatus Omnitrophota bacterium]
MKIVRFLHQKHIAWAAVEDNNLVLLRDEPFCGIRLSSVKIPLHRVKLLAPTIPSKVILTGLNYKDHARELRMSLPKEPVLFLKPPTAVIGHNDVVVYPKEVKRLDYEAELAVVIGKKCKNVSAQKAHRYIFGYTCLNDITARDIQRRDVQWTRAKSFDTFCPIGPWVETQLKAEDLIIKLSLNGVLRQLSVTSELIFSIPHIISFASRVMTLLPGDVISTGTPHGVGPMKRGDTVEVDIEGIGLLRNYIR